MDKDFDGGYMKFEITIPVLNEEETLELNINKIVDFFCVSSIKDASIVIADNGSTDATQSIGQRLEKEIENVKFLKVPRRGVGLALRTSWLQSTADIVGYMDLDLATDIEHLNEVVMMFENGAEVVNGSRLLKDSIVVNRSSLRETTSRGFNFLAKLLLKYNISDGMCGFKFFKRETVTSLINTGIETDGWFFSTEVLAKAEWEGNEIIEIPVKWTDDRNSKVKVVNLSIDYLKELLRLRKEKEDFISRKGC